MRGLATIDQLPQKDFCLIYSAMDVAEVLLAVDPSLRGTGYAVLERVEGRVRCVYFDVIKNPPKLTVAGCLLEIHTRLRDAIERFSPQAMAVESVIYVQSFPTAITLGSARGAVLLAAAQRGLPIHEYAPRRVKQAVVGNGAAQKAQVAFMVRSLLGLTVTPPADAADAIAVGFTHFQSLNRPDHPAPRRR
jgi:crossover junction endodeoxyribonuclease RuvC